MPVRPDTARLSSNSTETVMAHADTMNNTKAGAQDALALLIADHRAVEKLFDAFNQAGADDLDAKTTLAQRACEQLTMHTIVEEELLYPAAQKALPADHKLDVEEAHVEHFLVKTLIAKFVTLRAGDRGFDATFRVMSEMVRHHIEEEERELFPELRRTACDLATLGSRMATRKDGLQAKLDAVGSRSVGDRSGGIGRGRVRASRVL
jgi:hemerythrin superfamily protein